MTPVTKEEERPPPLPPEEIARRRGLLASALQREQSPLARHLAVQVYQRLRLRSAQERREAAAELMQGTAERALRDAHLYDPALPALPWLIHLSHYVLGAHNTQRGREARRRVDLDALDERLLRALCPQRSTDPTRALEERCDGARALRLLEELPEAQRKILTLRFIEGRDGKELAVLLGAVSTGAVRIRLARALQALRTKYLAEGRAEVTP